MSESSVVPQVHQTFDVHGDFLTKVPFDHKVFLDLFTDGCRFGIRELVDTLVVVDTGGIENLA
jgi:hypothetical protein